MFPSFYKRSKKPIHNPGRNALLLLSSKLFLSSPRVQELSRLFFVLFLCRVHLYRVKRLREVFSVCRRVKPRLWRGDFFLSKQKTRVDCREANAQQRLVYLEIFLPAFLFFVSLFNNTQGGTARAAAKSTEHPPPKKRGWQKRVGVNKDQETLQYEVFVPRNFQNLFTPLPAPLLDQNRSLSKVRL